MTWSTLVIANAFTLLGTLLGAWLALRAKRLEADLGLRARQWDSRRELYVRVVHAVDTAERAVGRVYPDNDEPIENAAPTLSKEEGGRLLAELMAIGSDSLRQLVKNFNDAHFDLYLRIDEVRELESHSMRAAAERSQLRLRRDELFQIGRSIEEQVRADLSVTTPK